MASSSNLCASSSSPHLMFNVYTGADSPKYTKEGRRDCPVVTVPSDMEAGVALMSSNKWPKSLPFQPL